MGKTARLVLAVLATLALSSGGALAAREAPQGTESNGPSASDFRAAPESSPGVELTAKRTEFSRTYRLPDGKRLTRIFEAPVNYRTADGELAPVGAKLVEREDGSARNDANRFDLLLPDRLGEDAVHLAIGEHWVSSRLLGYGSAEADLNGAVAEYKTTRSGVDLKLTSLDWGVKEEIELADSSQPNRFEFELRASPGLTPRVTGTGSIEFKDGRGAVAVALPAPLMYDSSPGRPDLSRSIDYELRDETGGAWRLAIVADRDWLEADGRVWPVKVDPSLHIPSPALDCSIWGSTSGYYGPNGEGFGTCGSGGEKYLYATDEPGDEDYWRRSLVRFDLSAIPSSSEVQSATISLHSPWEAWNTSGVELRRATKTWTDAATWKKYNATNSWSKYGGDFTTEGSEILTSERGPQAGWWDFSDGLLPVVKAWVSGSTANQGLLLKLIDDPRECEVIGSDLICTQRRVYLESSAAPDQEKRPYMDVVYYPPAPAASKVTSPTEGQKTARRLKLQAAWEYGVTGVSFQFREGNGGPFETIPSKLVRDAQGEEVQWPLAVEGKESEPVYFDALNAAAGLIYNGGQLEVRALFEGPPGVGGYSVPAKATVDRFIGSGKDATADVGPGSVNLLTGNLTVSRTDVSFPSFGSDLEFSRSHNSRNDETADKGGVLGAGWKPTVPVEAAGGAVWQKVVEFKATEEEEEYGLGDYALLTDLEGYEYEFEKSGGDYVSPSYAPELLLSRQDSTHLAVADVDGNRTVFTKNGSASEYLPTEISQTGGTGNKTRMVYSTSGAKRLTKVIAPTPAGVTCNESTATTTTGCRVLTFTYQPATTWGAPGSYGDRLSGITFHAHPAAAAQVAAYAYSSTGQLTEVWDPRISPALKETYTYTSPVTSNIKTITPPGQELWTLQYGAFGGEFANGRLVRVKRPSLLEEPSVAQTTIVYNVPVTGSNAPHDMSGDAVGKWGQEDLPTDATAIFPPDQIPAETPSSYSRATIHYLDAEGMSVNEALPSGGGASGAPITTTETDEHGNVVRELSAQNRLRALAAGSKSASRSHELETKRVFSSDGIERIEEWGPLHETRLKSGETVQARMHTTVQYDQGAPTPPEGTPPPHVPTYETVGASISGQGTDADQRSTQTQYNWILRQPTDTITDPGGLNLRTHVEYDAASGLVTERRLPANPEGGDAHSTRILYYTAGTHPVDSACGNNSFSASLPCKVGPAVQPGTESLPDLPVTKYTYNWLGLVTQEKASVDEEAGKYRYSSHTYDAAGRVVDEYETFGAGTALPRRRTTYSTTTGLPVKQHFVDACEEDCDPWDDQATTTSYDTLGRVIEYKDADGNAASSDYDLLGRPVTTSDGKGTQTRTYNATSGLLVKLEDSVAGTFTASYDADGNLVERDLPNGLRAQTTYDESGTPVHLSYEKPGPGESGPLPVAALSFDEGEGETAADSVDGHDGTIKGASWTSNGKYGSALEFDGVDDRVSVADSEEIDLTDEFTLEAWVRPDTESSWLRPVLGKAENEGGYSGYMLFSRFLGTPGGYVADSGSGKSVTGSAALPAEDWSHLALTSDGTTLRLYIDGELDASAPAIAAQETDADLQIGYNQPLGTYFDGLIDEVRLYDEELDEAEIQDDRDSQTTGCEEDCTWLEFDVEESIHRQWLKESGTLSTEEYGYDAAGRLTLVKDIPQGGECTTRAYSYDADSNREALVTRAPIEGGACDTTSTGEVQSYSYDKADRLLGSGIAYDDYGRITKLPSVYAGGGDLASTYYKNDLIRSQTQDGITNTYELDAELRQRQRTRIGGGGGIEIYHYADDSDSPAWIDRGESWERNIEGIEGDLAAIEDSASKETTLQLADLHGDIVATASLDPEASKPLQTFEFDEFGNPEQEGTPEYGWLGGKQRRSELPSGVIQMGVRSYVPALGRFTSPDPVLGGSANAYDYAFQDPVNMTDLDGQCPWCIAAVVVTAAVARYAVSRYGARLAARYVTRNAARKASTSPIKGYTRHGLHRVISRDGGRGVHPKAILDAVRRPKRSFCQRNGTTKYVGREATVVLNRRGKVVTAWGKPRNKVPKGKKKR